MGNSASIRRPMKLCNMEREIKTQPRLFRRSELFRTRNHVQSIPTLYQCDDHAFIDQDECEIRLAPQGIVLTFEVIPVDTGVTFSLSRSSLDPYGRSTSEVMSDQVLIPLCRALGIAPSDAILHLYRDSELHLRILSNQLGKIWLVDENELFPFFVDDNPSSWKITITDHNTWSTGSV